MIQILENPCDFTEIDRRYYYGFMFIKINFVFFRSRMVISIPTNSVRCVNKIGEHFFCINSVRRALSRKDKFSVLMLSLCNMPIDKRTKKWLLDRSNNILNGEDADRPFVEYSHVSSNASYLEETAAILRQSPFAIKINFRRCNPF